MHLCEKTVAGVWQRHNCAWIILAILPLACTIGHPQGKCLDPTAMIGQSASLAHGAWPRRAAHMTLQVKTRNGPPSRAWLDYPQRCSNPGPASFNSPFETASWHRLRLHTVEKRRDGSPMCALNKEEDELTLELTGLNQRLLFISPGQNEGFPRGQNTVSHCRFM